MGPNNQVEARIWEALEPLLEDVIDLDLNIPEECRRFGELCKLIADSLPTNTHRDRFWGIVSTRHA